MDYISYRIDRQWIKNHKVVNGWFILGQKYNDYNWELLYETTSFKEAIKFITSVNTNQRVYGRVDMKYQYNQ